MDIGLYRCRRCILGALSIFLEHFSLIFPMSLRARRIVHTVFALAPRANRLKNALEPVENPTVRPAPSAYPAAAHDFQNEDDSGMSREFSQAHHNRIDVLDGRRRRRNL